MKPEELKIIRERAELTPGGKWSWKPDRLISDETEAALAWAVSDVNDDLYIGLMEEVAEFIPHAREDILKLLDEAEMLQCCLPWLDVWHTHMLTNMPLKWCLAQQDSELSPVDFFKLMDDLFERREPDDEVGV